MLIYNIQPCMYATTINYNTHCYSISLHSQTHTDTDTDTQYNNTNELWCNAITHIPKHHRVNINNIKIKYITIYTSFTYINLSYI